MEKNKLNYITYLVIFCVILSFVGCFFLGTYFGEKETVTKTEEKNPDEEIFKSAKIEDQHYIILLKVAKEILMNI